MHKKNTKSVKIQAADRLSSIYIYTTTKGSVTHEEMCIPFKKELTHY